MKKLFYGEIAITTEQKEIFKKVIMPLQKTKNGNGFFTVPNYLSIWHDLLGREEFLDLEKQRRDTFLFFKGFEKQDDIWEYQRFYIEMLENKKGRYIIIYPAQGKHNPFKISISDGKSEYKKFFFHLHLNGADETDDIYLKIEKPRIVSV